jgi:hypothetical protein
MSARSTAGVTLNRLRTIVEAYGADPRRWPEAERGSAEALVAESTAARDLVARAGRLDAALAEAAADVPDAALARLTAATAFPPPRESRPRTGGGWLNTLASAFWPRATVLASMAVLGIIVGLAVEPTSPTVDGNTAIVSDLNADIGEDLGL